MKLIKREHYLRQLRAVKNIPDIKVITGVRRSGKSKLMDAYADELEKQSDTNVVRIKLNLRKYRNLLDADELYTYVESKYQSDRMNYLLIDEIQLCKGFETVINSLFEEEIYDIYLTGSNAFLLSSDLATLFGGRVFEIKMFPFSFEEYMEYYPSDDIDRSFEDYFMKGGMSGSYLYQNDADALKYIGGIFRTTIVRDIVQKYRIENEDLLVMIADFLMDNVGNRTSVRNVSAKLTSDSYRTNDKTAGNYIRYLCRSFLFYPVQRYDIRGKKYLETDKKYYLADLSFRRAELGSRYTDYGHLYENLVLLELLRRGYEVYIGQLYQKEVNFVVKKNGSLKYIQVSDDISSSSSINREISPLLSIKDAYPKMIIARTKHATMEKDGVQIVDIARWLSNSQL